MVARLLHDLQKSCRSEKRNDPGMVAEGFVLAEEIPLVGALQIIWMEMKIIPDSYASCK